MDLDADAFISYAHVDNVRLDEGHDGWVAALHRALERRLPMLLGKDVKVWWDPKLRGNDVFSDMLVAQIQNVSALISVVTPRYIRSEWTIRELNEFCRAAEQRGGITVGDKSRIFKVLKTPVPVDEHPPQLRPLLGYPFFKEEKGTGRIRELDEIYGEELRRDYWIMVDNLANDICALLKVLEKPEAHRTPAVDAVFLAQTTTDLRAERDVIRRALQQRGLTVLPMRDPGDSVAEVIAATAEDLSRCRMSIHMFGMNYGVVPEGCTQSLLELQNELAIERAADRCLQHLVWMPEGLATSDERQRKVIQRLRTDERTHHNSDLLETSLEELQTVIETRLKQDAQPGRVLAQRSLGETAQPVYLVYDQRDAAGAGRWADFLFEHFEVLTPAFDCDEAEFRQFHEDALRTCVGVVILQGAANQVWLRRKLAEVQKSAAGRVKPMPPVAVCLIPPASPEKARFRTHLATVIDQTAGFSAEPLESFVNALKERATEPPG